MTNPPEPALSVIMGERRQLINLAYRLLGTLADAEDVVQETYARWYAMPVRARLDIRRPGAWLTTVASRLCLNILTSARARRETYVGEWIPEPLPEPGEWAVTDPADKVTLDESVNMAFLIVLDAMTPAERVSFILHDVFGYPFAEVGRIVGRSDVACRQLASSARRRLRTAHTPAPLPDQAGVVREFKAAWEAGDITALIGLLDPDATATGDGGGRARTSRHPIQGAESIVRSLHALFRRLGPMTLLESTVNGQPGLVVQRDGVTVTVAAFHVVRGRIRHIWAVRNPDKLRAWTPATAVK